MHDFRHLYMDNFHNLSGIRATSHTCSKGNIEGEFFPFAEIQMNMVSHFSDLDS